ncbi:MAG TPA: DUF2780 domain-containing protein [Vicinamibacterales bacterium]|jgi:hypothetical protein
MTWQGCLGIAGLALVVATARVPSPQAAADAAKQTAAASQEAADAAKASPELVGELSKELGATPEQAAGAAGALFGVAKSQLKPEEFSQVAAAVPGMDSLLKAAPAGPSEVGTAGALSKMAGSAGGLASAASAFSKLGLKPEMVSKAVPVLTQFVTKSGGANVGSLLSGVLK